MGKLVLDSLEIRQFRAFRHLRIERLGRVNLIVGKNNVGKTALLEALWLYANRGSLALIYQLLSQRDEVAQSSSRAVSVAEQGLAIKNLYFGRNDIFKSPEPIQIGTLTSPQDTIIIASGFNELVSVNGKLGVRTRLANGSEPEQSSEPEVIIIGGQRVISRSVRNLFQDIPVSSRQEIIPHVFIPSNGLNRGHLDKLWTNVALTESENDVINSLRVISPSLERVGLVSNPNNVEERIPIAKLVNQATPVALRSLGEGMNRMFGIALGLANARNGLLLIDEVESGLHYSVQYDLWKLIFKTARRLNVQVFATTHSWDCIEGFQAAAHEATQDEGLLIRLGRKKEEIVATIYDEAEMLTATREHIEVR